MITKNLYRLPLIFMILIMTAPVPVSFAQDFYCEVMSVKGGVTVSNGDYVKHPVKEGDLLKEGDTIDVPGDGYLDLAYDKEWNNVTRFFENSRVKIRGIYPTDLAMEYGDIIAKLDKLPRNSTFEIETPTAIAAVRGSAFETIHRDDETAVMNFHDSTVHVFGVDDGGNIVNEIQLAQFERTEVEHLEAPAPPHRMSKADVERGKAFLGKMETATKDLEEGGRIGKLLDTETINVSYKKDLIHRLQERILANNHESTDSEDSPSGKGTGLHTASDKQGPHKVYQLAKTLGAFYFWAKIKLHENTFRPKLKKKEVKLSLKQC